MNGSKSINIQGKGYEAFKKNGRVFEEIFDRRECSPFVHIARKFAMTKDIGIKLKNISMNIQMLSSVMVYARNVPNNITLTSAFLRMYEKLEKTLGGIDDE